MIGSLSPDTYLITVSDANGCTGATAATVFLPPSVSIASNNDSVCLGGSVILKTTVSDSVGILTYEWQKSLNLTTWNAIPSTNSATYTAITSSVERAYYRVIVASNVGGNCADTSAVLPITVVDKPAVSVVVNTSNVCLGGYVILTATQSGGVGTCSLEWQSSTNNGTTWSTMSGVTSNTHIVMNLDNTIRFRVQITCAGSGCCN